MIARVQNWPTLLAQFIEDRRSMPFAWGSNDCCIFAADWIKKASGTDLAEHLRGRYTTALGAMRFLQRRNGVVALVDSIQDLARIDCAMIQRGDIVARDVNNGIGLGICIGQFAAFVTKDGLAFVPINDQKTKAAWHF